jgi:hypothetical protein
MNLIQVLKNRAMRDGCIQPANMEQRLCRAAPIRRDRFPQQGIDHGVVSRGRPSIRAVLWDLSG